MSQRERNRPVRYRCDAVLDRIYADSDSDTSEISDVELDDSDCDEDYVVNANANNNSNNNQSDMEVSGSDSDHEDQRVRHTPANSIDWVPMPCTNDGYVPVWCPAYNRRAGPNFPPMLQQTEKHPINYFSLLFPDSAFELMCEQTNNYAVQFFDNPVGVSESSRFREWVDSSVNEMKAYVGLQIFMGICSKPKLPDYWGLLGVDKTPGFGEIMSRNRFQLLNSFLHFCDNEARVPRGEDGHDPLYKIKPLLDMIVPLAKLYYTPAKEISIDESMKRFKGRIYFRQYIPNKPTRWGIKMWSLCESKTGYLLDWNVYTGKGNNPVNENTGLGHNVVMDLMQGGFVDCGHHLFVDNFYTSPDLFKALQALNTGACGTVRVTRKHLPEAIKKKNLKLKKGDDPVFFRKGDAMVCSWHDTARVNFLSTIDNTGCTDKQIRSKNFPNGYRDVKKPNVASNYNAFMGGVDLFDQLAACYTYPHKVQKWYLAIYHFAKEAALVNSYILYKADNPASTLNSADFRRKVAESLCDSVAKTRFSNRGRRSTDNFEEMDSRLKERHFPIKFENPKYLPNCIVCSESPSHPRRKQTRDACGQCKDGHGKSLAMCSPGCFTRYHTIKHFRR